MASTPIDTGLETRSITAPETILEMRSITKEFPGVKALADVSLSVRAGEIHAICGENGAGKSTLMKVLSGRLPVQAPTAARSSTRAREVRFSNIKQSEQAGIVIIHQELALVPELSITENLFLGNEPSRAGVINWTAAQLRAQDLLARVGLADDPDTQIKNIGVGKQQLVEIAKALHKDVKLLILDEPTAALNENDSQHLLDLIVGLKAKGIASIIISHKLNEIEQIADEITIIRDGKAIETLNVKADGVNEDRIIRGMVGRSLGVAFPRPHPEDRRDLLRGPQLDRAAPDRPVASGLQGVELPRPQGRDRRLRRPDGRRTHRGWR
ncbi:ATP-binding cassette domain-containing protein [Curtobacterium flaccumfaciens]|nr:ATP-binding cassette domain-containing protein [Curtobacterium flaccumfaciens]